MIMLKQIGERRRYFLQCDSCTATRKANAINTYEAKLTGTRNGWRNTKTGLICPACQVRKENR